MEIFNGRIYTSLIVRAVFGNWHISEKCLWSFRLFDGPAVVQRIKNSVNPKTLRKPNDCLSDKTELNAINDIRTYVLKCYENWPWNWLNYGAVKWWRVGVETEYETSNDNEDEMSCCCIGALQTAADREPVAVARKSLSRMSEVCDTDIGSNRHPKCGEILRSNNEILLTRESVRRRHGPVRV